MVYRLFHLVWPLFLAQLAVAGMAVTDTFVAGRVGTDALAVVAIGANLLLLGIMFVYGMLLVLSPISARFRVGLSRRLPILLRQALVVGLVSATGAVLFLFSGLFFFKDLLNEKVADDVLMFLLLGVPALFLSGMYFPLRLMWEGLNHTFWTAQISLLLFLINIPLDWLFVVEMGLGGAGCALATSVSFLVGTLWALWRYGHDEQLSRILSGMMRAGMDWPVMKMLIYQGVPAALALLSEVSLFMLLALLIAPFGVVALAGHQIAINITSALYVLPFSLSLALAIETGRLRGVGDARSLRRLMRLGMLLSFLVGLGLSVLTWLMHDHLPGWFTGDAAVKGLAAQLLLFAAAYQIMDALQMGSAGILRGLGDTRWILVATMISYWLVGIPLGAWLAWGREWAVEGYWMGIVVALGLASVLLGGRVMTHYRRLI